MPNSIALRIVLPLLWLGMMCGDVSASTQTLAGLKAAYVYNIAKFTRWPDSAWDRDTSPFHLCLYGEGDVIVELEALENRKIRKHEIRVQKPQKEGNFAYCHLLYISDSERRRFRYLLSLVNQWPVLTISDEERFLRDGGMINLTEDARRLRFEVNMAQLPHTELRFSSKLLKLAILVDKPR